MSEKRICPLSQAVCRLGCSEASEYCFDMRTACHTEIRAGHEQFGKVADFIEEPPQQGVREQGDFNYQNKNSQVKAHAKLHNKVYFQGIDKKQLNPSTEQNAEANRKAEEIQLRNALRYKNTPRYTPY